jgi:hypothetical protein
LEKSWLQASGIRKLPFIRTFILGDNSKLHLLYCKNKRSERSHLSNLSHKKTSELLLLQYNAWLHASVHTTETIINFEWTMLLLHQPYSADLIPSDYHLYRPLKKIICEDIITSTTWYCRLLWPEALDEGQQHLLFKCKRGLLTKMETTLESNCVQQCSSKILWHFHMSNLWMHDQIRGSINFWLPPVFFSVSDANIS